MANPQKLITSILLCLFVTCLSCGTRAKAPPPRPAPVRTQQPTPAPQQPSARPSQPQVARSTTVQARPTQTARVELGSEVLAKNGFRELRGKRVGLITNPSGVNRSGQTTIDLLRRAPGVKLVALFGPEHGVYGDILAGQKVVSLTDKRTGLLVHSLYGNTRKPTAAMLKGLDVLVYDLQDIGSRSYTFISTMGLAMEAAGEANIEFMVLDRPNPLGGLRVEGNLLDPKFRSFVGQYPIPYVYGMTCGELALMIHGEKWMKRQCKLTVIPMHGWKRSMAWQHTGLRWVPTSPKIPKQETALHYSSTGVLGEIGGVNIGMGFGMPFQCLTAPWIDPQKMSAQMKALNLRGVDFPPFTAKAGNRQLKGVKIDFKDPVNAPLVPLNFYALDAIRKTTGRNLFNEALKNKKNFQMFDLINGTDATRKMLTAGHSGASIVNSWKQGESKFRQQRQKYLLYN